MAAAKGIKPKKNGEEMHDRGNLWGGGGRPERRKRKREVAFGRMGRSAMEVNFEIGNIVCGGGSRQPSAEPTFKGIFFQLKRKREAEMQPGSLGMESRKGQNGRGH